MFVFSSRRRHTSCALVTGVQTCALPIYQIKDEIIQAFLPRAFIRKSGTFAAIDAERGLILVNSASPKKAEDLLSTLREAIGSLPVRPLTRSEVRRVGKECGSTCRSRWSPYD